MQSSNAPNKIQLPFAASGTKNTIPVPSQQGVTPGAASFTDGFPPLTFTPLSAGGVPPSGADFNGVLNAITALQQWKSAGGQFPFDATFAAAIGGYPKGATVLKADGTGLWISTAENNTTNPDTGGAGWLAFSASSIQAGSYNTAPDTGTANNYVVNLSPAPAALTNGMVITFTAANSNTGPSTINVNGLGAKPIGSSYSASPLAGGEILAGSVYQALWNSNYSGFTLINSSILETGNAVSANQAVSLGQFQAMHGIQVFTTSGSFTPPPGVTKGYVSGCGGGSGGGGGAGTTPTPLNGAGGSAGQVALMQAVALVPGVPITVTIGAGSLGGAGGGESGAGAPSAPGGQTTFGSAIVLNGGAGANGGQSTGPSYGYSTTSVVSVTGGSGYTFLLNSGVGQSGPFGLGGSSVGTVTSDVARTGGSASGYGAGGGGGGTTTAASSSGGAGGSGSSGIIIVEW